MKANRSCSEVDSEEPERPRYLLPEGCIDLIDAIRKKQSDEIAAIRKQASDDLEDDDIPF